MKNKWHSSTHKQKHHTVIVGIYIVLLIQYTSLRYALDQLQKYSDILRRILIFNNIVKLIVILSTIVNFLINSTHNFMSYLLKYIWKVRNSFIPTRVSFIKMYKYKVQINNIDVILNGAYKKWKAFSYTTNLNFADMMFFLRTLFLLERWVPILRFFSKELRRSVSRYHLAPLKIKRKILTKGHIVPPG